MVFSLKVMGLKEILSEFIKHRQGVIRRRTEFELRKAKERAHILEGLKIALDHIDEVIKTIRESYDDADKRFDGEIWSVRNSSGRNFGDATTTIAGIGARQD